MSRYGYGAMLLASLLLHASVSAAVGATSQPVHLRGSTTLLPIAQKVGEEYMNGHPSASIVLSGGGTARGYKAILDGTADIGMASGDAPEDIATELERRNIKLSSVTVGYDALVTVVHPSNPVGNLRLDQLKNIFTGRITNWKDVGGKNAPIQVLVGPPTGGITESWKKLILTDEDTYTPAGVVLDSAARIELLATRPLAITFLTFAAVKPGIKILSVDGVAADAATVLDGRYHLRVPLMLVTTGTPSAAAKEFIKYFAAPRKTQGFDGIVHVQSNVESGVESKAEPKAEIKTESGTDRRVDRGHAHE